MIIIQSTANEGVAREMYKRYDQYFKFKQFLSHVKVGRKAECWIWKGSLTKNGYGRFKWETKHLEFAHQASYELFKGSRKGLFVLHTCDNPSCVNPKHLWLGTQKDNVHDMMNKGRRFNNGGERNAHSLLTLKQVKKIRRRYNKGGTSYGKLARKYNVSRSTIEKIVTGVNWPESSYSKIDLELVESIKELYKTGKYTQSRLSRKFNVEQATIFAIINEGRWVN